MNYYGTLTKALDDVLEHGYDSPARVAYWAGLLKETAEDSFKAPGEMEGNLRRALTSTYSRLVDRGGVLQLHPHLSKVALDRLKPQLQVELDRRIMAAASVVRMRRDEAIQSTLRNFIGWATSVPSGGTPYIYRRAKKAEIRRPLSSAMLSESNVVIDQTGKLTSAVHHCLAHESGAIAAQWHSKYQQPGYNYREDHKERHGHVYIIRGSWAHQDGLIGRGARFTDSITLPAEEPHCKCRYNYLYRLDELPPEMLTRKGRAH
jgi:hypothetical protein